MPILNVPYLAQTDNELNPSGACNVTSMAMVFKFLGVKRNPRYERFKQLEDELYQFMLDKGLSRHSPYDLQKMAKLYGVTDNFTVKATLKSVKESIDKGMPVVIHGYFTKFGHIVTCIGYDTHGLIIHDPWGEWFADGYRPDLSGDTLHYSYGLIQQTCMTGGEFWCHFFKPLSKRGL